MINEPLTEIKQVKGTSETTPEFSPTDEFASFELMNYLIGIDNSKSNPHGSYAREAYKNGLAMQDTRGYNPYKFGFVGAGDSHNTATAYSQSNYFGDHASIDPTPEARLSGKVDTRAPMKRAEIFCSHTLEKMLFPKRTQTNCQLPIQSRTARFYPDSETCRSI